MNQRWLTYDEVCLLPSYSTLNSRVEPSLETKFTKKTTISMPFIPSPMSSVINIELGKKLFEKGVYPVFHRFYKSTDELDKWLETLAPHCYISWGLENLDELTKLIKGKADIFHPKGVCLDVAHGHTQAMYEAITYLKFNVPKLEIIAGTVCTPNAVMDLASWGADAIRVGIGGGCFASGTRVLMSNGVYKNIEDIQSGDRVINKEGIPVNVKRAFKSGYKKLSSLRTNIFYKNTFVTADHNYWIGDLSSTSQSTLSAHGYVKLLERQTAATPRASKLKWKSIGEVDRGCLLMPKKIDFEFAKSFEISLEKRSGGNWRSGYSYSIDTILIPSYELGYIFGTFLGDGNTHNSVYNNSNRGSVHWAFGKDEINIAKKLRDCIFKVFNKEVVIKEISERNIIKVSFYYKPFSDFLQAFGKRNQKKLPEEYLVGNIEYLTGMFEGLIDSDGHYSTDNRISFLNTSSFLIELFNILTYVLKGYFPNNEEKPPSIGGLINCNIDNCASSYNARLLKQPEYRMSENFQVVKVLDYKEIDLWADVYDIEVECDTHSFIANNSIVHNSACTTRLVTGFGAPQFTALLECSRVARRHNVPIIADGGIRDSRDISLALAAGASSVMMGKLFSATDESAAELYGDHHKIYKGQASSEFQKTGRASEGEQGLVKKIGSVDNLLTELSLNLKTSLSYAGAKNIEQFREKVQWVEVGSGYKNESSTRFDISEKYLR